MKKINQKKSSEKEIYADIVIVGAGTHGLFLYDQLKSKFKKIIIIEKGNYVTKKAKTHNISNSGKFHNGTKNLRAIGVGGNST